MPVSDPRGPLTSALLERLARRADGYDSDPGLLAEDLELLREAGYLAMAVPERFGGAGLTLPQVACAQRRLAYRAPAAALAVNAHQAWVGAAAGAHAAGDSSADWLLGEASRGRLFGGPGGAADDLLAAKPGARPSPVPAVGGLIGGREAPGTASPGWDWLGVQGVDDSEPERPKIVHAFIRRSDLGCRPARVVVPGPPGDPFIAGVFGWGLPLDGELCYAMARRAFDLADEHLGAADGDDRYAADPATRGELAEAALRLEGLRDQLDATLHGWRERAQAGGAVATLDPGGQWLIRLFTVRHIAAEGAWRVMDLSAQALTESLTPAA